MAKTKGAAILILDQAINLQIDVIIKEIQKASWKSINANVANLFVDALKYIKIIKNKNI